MRTDLLAKYPSIVDHSSNTSLCSLVSNSDYTLLTAWDPASSSPLPTVLNRPAPALYPSSFDLPLGAELLKPKVDQTGTHHAPTPHIMQLRFFRLEIELLWATVTQNAPLLRSNLASFQSVLQEMGVANLSPVSAEAAEEPAAVSFDDNHWRLCFLLMDCSACVVESAAHTTAFLDAPASPAAGSDAAAAAADSVAQLCLRWSSVQRQLGIVTSLLETSTADVASRFFLPLLAESSSSSSSAPATASLASSSANPAALRDLASLSQFALTWLTIAVQMWATAVPNKKLMVKKRQQQAAKLQKDASAPVATEETADPLLECVLSVRLSLASLIKVLRSSLQTLQAPTNKLAARVRAAAASSSSAAAPSLLAASSSSAPSTLPVLNTAEHSDVLRSVHQHIETSHAHTGAQLLLMLNAIEQPLQHIKL